jgi:hypothetical protein
MLAQIAVDGVQYFRIVVDGENDWLRHWEAGSGMLP